MAKILLVDDDPSLLCVLSNLLTTEGYTVSATLRGDKAWHMLKSDEAFDMLISDMRMNPITGAQLLELALEERPVMPVIIITAYYSQANANDALAKGALAYVAKPWHTDELLDTIRKGLAEQKTA